MTATTNRTPEEVRVHFEPLPVRDPGDAIISPTPEELADGLRDPSAEIAQYRITYERVGRRGGRDGSKPPPPLIVQAITPEGIADRILADIAPFLLSHDIDVWVDLKEMRGGILCGFNNGGTFTIVKTEVAR